MKMSWLPIAALTWGGLLLGCGERDPNVVSEISVDTLPDGIVLVKNPRKGMWGGRPEWRLVHQVTIGGTEGNDPGVFGEIRGLAVDSRGLVYILDHHAAEVRVFDGDGRHVRSFGEPGAGPGELLGAFGLGIDSSDRVWVADQGNNRYTLWDSDGGFIRTVPRPLSSWPMMWSGGTGFDGRRLVESATVGRERGDPQFSFLSVSTEEQVIDTFPAPASTLRPEAFSPGESSAPLAPGDPSQGPPPQMLVPFQPRRVISNVADGGYWVGTGDAYRLHYAGLPGDTLRIVELDATITEVTQSERDSLMATETVRRIEEAGGEVDPSRIPDRKPYFDNMWVDDGGNLWVRVPTAFPIPGTRIDVFDELGRYQGQVETAHNIEASPLPVVRGGMMWAHVRDELGVSSVVGIRIERNP